MLLKITGLFSGICNSHFMYIYIRSEKELERMICELYLKIQIMMEIWKRKRQPGCERMIIVVGSTNFDTVMRVKSLTRDGETTAAKRIQQYLGGKGANQAVGVAKLGSKCCFMTSFGSDWTGKFLSSKFSEFNISLYSQHSNDLSGQAFIEVNDAGMNRIIVYSGANALLDEAFLDRYSHILEKADLILLQGEVPWDTNLHILKTYGKKCPIVLDPAPAIPEMLVGIEKATFVTPNESEFSILSGKQYNSLEEIIEGAKDFQKKFRITLILKLGKNGCAFFSDTDSFIVSPIDGLKVVDTTGAGDSFNAAFAVALELGYEIRKAIKFAVLVSGISTMNEGTSSAMPTDIEVRALEKKLNDDQPKLIELQEINKHFRTFKTFP